MAIVGIVAVGETIVMISGGFDLSVGSAMAASGMLSAYLLNEGWALWLAVPAALVLGGGHRRGQRLDRLLHAHQPADRDAGDARHRARARRSSSRTARRSSSATRTILDLGTAEVGPVPLIVLIMLALFVLLGLVMPRTRFGRYTYAIGSNARASRLAGVPLHRYRIAFYVTCGTLAALGGIVTVARVGSAQPTANLGAELDVITAVILGGTSLNGGRGRLLGTFLGLLLIAVLNNGLILMDVQSYWQQVVKGAVLLAGGVLGRAAAHAARGGVTRRWHAFRSSIRTSTCSTCASRGCATRGWSRTRRARSCSGPTARSSAQRYYADDFVAETRFQNVERVVHVQAAIGTEDPVEETRWLQAFADRARRAARHRRVRRTWRRRRRRACSTATRRSPNLRGIRDLRYDDYLCDEAWRAGLRALAAARTWCWCDDPLLEHMAGARASSRAASRASRSASTTPASRAGATTPTSREWRDGHAGAGRRARDRGRQDLRPRHVRPRVDGRVAAAVGRDVPRAVGRRARLLRHRTGPSTASTRSYGDVLDAYAELISGLLAEARAGARSSPATRTASSGWGT